MTFLALYLRLLAVMDQAERALTPEDWERFVEAGTDRFGLEAARIAIDTTLAEREDEEAAA